MALTVLEEGTRVMSSRGSGVVAGLWAGDGFADERQQLRRARELIVASDLRLRVVLVSRQSVAV
ncbi:MAG: hypothetical protein ACRDSL_24675 [Pseudonocardiaceae bacterium]